MDGPAPGLYEHDGDEGWHSFLVEQGFEWARYEEPSDGMKRKYWKTVPERPDPG